MPDVELRIDDQMYGGWTRARVERGIEQVAGAFDLSVTERWPESPARRPIAPGAACELRLDDEVVITGFVDDVAPSYDELTHSVAVRGRDATGDLVDASARQGQWKGQTLLQVARAVAKPFGIEVTDRAGATHVFSTLATDTGETAHELLERGARHAGVLLVSDGRGGLVLTRAGAERIATVLELGRNIKRAAGSYSHRGRFSEYTVVGQREGEDSWFGAAASEPAATARDTRIRRHRPIFVPAEETITPEQAQRRADWQRNVAFGRSQQVTYTVQGWRHEAGLWQPNVRVPVRDPFMGLDGDWLLVHVVQLIDDEGGQLSELTLMPPEAFDLLPLPEEQADAWFT